MACCHAVLVVKNLPAHAGDLRDAGFIPGSGRFPLEKMATHSSILAWRISGTEEACGLQSIGRGRTWLKWLSTRSVIKTAYKLHGICPVLSLRNNLESFKIIRFFDSVILSANYLKNDLIFWKSDMMKAICGMRLVVHRQGESVIGCVTVSQTCLQLLESHLMLFRTVFPLVSISTCS